jgi:hypothetical protein
MLATSGRAGREIIAATFEWDFADLAMLRERKKDCTEFGRKNLQAPETRRSGTLEDSVQQELAVTFGAEDGRFNDIGARAAELAQTSSHFFDGSQLSRLIAHDASLANEFPSRLELGFHQDDYLTATALFDRTREGSSDHGRKNQGR